MNYLRADIPDVSPLAMPALQVAKVAAKPVVI
jgi:hypothetical protein